MLYKITPSASPKHKGIIVQLIVDNISLKKHSSNKYLSLFIDNRFSINFILENTRHLYEIASV